MDDEKRVKRLKEYIKRYKVTKRLNTLNEEITLIKTKEILGMNTCEKCDCESCPCNCGCDCCSK